MLPDGPVFHENLLLTEALSLPLCVHTQSSLLSDELGYLLCLLTYSEADPNVFCLHLVQLSISFMLSDSTHALLELPVGCGESLASCQRSESQYFCGY